MNAEVLSIGNEVLSGRTLDTNFQFLARLLEGNGARVVGHQAVPDREDAIADARARARSRADLIVCTGGLGPTPDDLTVSAVAAALNLPLVRDETRQRMLRERWQAWARDPMPANNERQALLPAGATAWPNPLGSAPGVHLAYEGKDFVLLPGVPEEMAALAQQSLAPFVRARSGIAVEYAQIRTVGIAESVLEERLADLEAGLDGAWVAYLPGLGGVDVRIALPVDAPAERRADIAARAGDRARASRRLRVHGR